MNTRRVAQALNTISVAFGELAEAIIEQPELNAGHAVTPVQGSGGVPPTSAPTLPPAEDWAAESSLLDDIFPADVKAAPRGETPQGSLVVCPKHRIAYEEGQYGLFCKQRTDDPAWGNDKNGTLWCRITPRNADVWLRAQAAVGA